MPITYSVDADKKIITEIWTGDVSASDLADYWRAYLSDSVVLEIRRTVVDLRQAAIHITGEQMRDLIRTIVVPILEGRDWKTAIVVAEPVQFGFGRQYGAFAHMYSQDQIFKDVDSATEWLSKQ